MGVAFHVIPISKTLTKENVGYVLQTAAQNPKQEERH